MYKKRPGTITQLPCAKLVVPDHIMPVLGYSALIVSSIELEIVLGTPTLAVNAL